MTEFTLTLPVPGSSISTLMLELLAEIELVPQVNPGKVGTVGGKILNKL